jgi:hypothetical protein
MEWVVNARPRPLYTQEIDPVPIVQEVRWATGPVWTGAEKLAAAGIRSPDPPARSESIYRLSYPGPLYFSLYPLNLKLGLSQGRSRRLGDQINNLASSGFRAAVHPAPSPSHCTNYAHFIIHTTLYLLTLYRLS